jgi:hypothetical protein
MPPLPALVLWPRRWTSLDLHSLGPAPDRLPRDARPDRVTSSTVAPNAVAVTGPTPGTVVRPYCRICQGP